MARAIVRETRAMSFFMLFTLSSVPPKPISPGRGFRFTERQQEASRRMRAQSARGAGPWRAVIQQLQ